MQDSQFTPASDAQTAAARAAAIRAAGAGARAVVALSACRILARLAFAAGLALFAGHLIEQETFLPWALALAFGGLIVAAAFSYAAEAVAARAEARAARAIERDIEDFAATAALKAVAAQPRGELIAGLHRRPAALAALVVTHKAARAMLAFGALSALSAMALVSWPAAGLILLATPVLILFFILIGKALGGRAREQEAAFGKLAAQFADRVRALPTILANQALEREKAKLRARMGAYADSVMGVLRVAFVNAGLIDFFSSLSIAMLAVFLGLGHLGMATLPGFSGLALWESLMILLFAPEYFGPLRKYSEQYHLKAEGAAAAEALAPFYGDHGAPPAPPSAETGRIARLEIAHVGATPDFDFGAAGLVAVTGASGAGKSTLLRVLAGVEAPNAGLAALPAGTRAWISGDVDVEDGRLADAIAHGAAADPARLADAIGAVTLGDEATLPGGLDAPIAPDGANLSGGQRMRVAVARALYAQAAVILADEPTAKLDDRSAAAVRAALMRAAKGALVIVATHDPDLVAAADRTLRLGDGPAAEVAAE